MSAEATEPRREFFAACPLASASCLRASCATLGIEVTRTHPAGVGFEGSLEHGSARLSVFADREPHRALARVGATRRDAEQFYGLVRAIPWEQHVDADGTHRRRHRRRRAGLGATLDLRGAEGQGCDRRSLPRARWRATVGRFRRSGSAGERAIRSRPRYARDRPRPARRCTGVAIGSRPSRRRSRKISPPRCCCVAAGPRSRPAAGHSSIRCAVPGRS